MDISKIKKCFNTGNLILFKSFIEDLDINKPYRGRTYLIHDAVYHRQLEFVKHLVSLHIDLGVKDGEGFTALHTACLFSSNRSMIQYLLSAGANVHATTSALSTPLHLAVHDRRDCIPLLLVAAGANPHSKNIWGETSMATTYHHSLLTESFVASYPHMIVLVGEEVLPTDLLRVLRRYLY